MIEQLIDGGRKTREALAALIQAARDMRTACVNHSIAHIQGSPDYGELAKADKAAVKRFEALAEKSLAEVGAE